MKLFIFILLLSTVSVSDSRTAEEMNSALSVLQSDTLSTEPSEKDYNLFWYEIGAGGWFTNDKYTQYHSLSYQFHENYYISLQYSINREETIYEFSGLFGIRSSARFGSISLAAGLGSLKGKYADKEFSTIGFPINAKAFFTPVKYIGIGLSIFGNLNPKLKYAGFSFNLQIGKLM